MYQLIIKMCNNLFSANFPTLALFKIHSNLILSPIKAQEQGVAQDKAEKRTEKTWPLENR